MRPTRKDDRESRRTVDVDGVVRIESRRAGGSRLALWGGVGVLLLAAAWLFFDMCGEPTGAGQAGGSHDPRPDDRSARTTGAADPRPSVPGEPARPAAPDGQAEIYLNQIDPETTDRTGIHAFPPPGSKPIAGGILVPDGYQLPPGYMRHYQTTDDGERVGPILVFHPDHRPVDRAGQPIPMPPGRVVPPELAPPGLPVYLLKPPPVRRDFDETSTPR